MAASWHAYEPGADPVGPTINGLPPTQVLPYYGSFGVRGDPKVVDASKRDIVTLLTGYESLYRTPAADAAASRKAAAVQGTRLWRSAVRRGSAADRESAAIQRAQSDAPVPAYSDNKFTLTKVVGIDATDVNHVFIVVDGHQSYLHLGPGGGSAGAHWTVGPVVQWQVRATEGPEGLQLTQVDQRSLPGTPSP